MITDFQKPSFLKRISAFLIDFICFVIIGTFFAFIVSLITNYSGHVADFKNYYKVYEDLYNINLTSKEAFNSFTSAELARYEEAIAAMNADKEVIKTWNLICYLPILMLSIASILSSLVVEFIMPLIFKNGQTLGKKIFNIAVIRPDGVKASTFQLFARSMLGKCTIEIMVPGIIIIMMVLGSIGIVGPIILGLIAIIEIVIFFRNDERFLLHDLIAYTACCNKSSQMIFNSEKEMIQYKEELSRKQAEQTNN